MVIITGPRQVGKTYIAKDLMRAYKKPVYLNYDDVEHFEIINKRYWLPDSDLVIFDEIHKMKKWKNYIKGTYDTKVKKQGMLITGSARLEAFRKTGDSLAGRYFRYRLMPLSVKELAKKMKPYEAVNALNTIGGFPEPFLSGSEKQAQRWRSNYFSDIVRDDVLELGRVNDLRTIRLLLEMLRKRVGAPISYKSLAGDLKVSPNTVKKYIEILESLFVIFIVRPYHRSIARSILKEPKVYFYDTGYVDMDEGFRLENTAAVCLLKHICFMNDTTGSGLNLNYIRTKDKKEVDFVISEGDKLTHLIEVKLSEKALSRNLKFFSEKMKKVKAIQLVHNLKNEARIGGADILNAGKWLAGLKA